MLLPFPPSPSLQSQIYRPMDLIHSSGPDTWLWSQQAVPKPVHGVRPRTQSWSLQGRLGPITPHSSRTYRPSTSMPDKAPLHHTAHARVLDWALLYCMHPMPEWWIGLYLMVCWIGLALAHSVPIPVPTPEIIGLQYVPVIQGKSFFPS